MKFGRTSAYKSGRTPQNNALRSETRWSLQCSSVLTFAAFLLLSPNNAYAQSTEKGGGQPAPMIVDPGGSCGGALDDPSIPPPEKTLENPANVDMRTGYYSYNQTDLAIGGSGGISLARLFDRDSFGQIKPGVVGGFSHNWIIRVNEKRVKVCDANLPKDFDYAVTVHAGPRTKSFRASADPEPDEFYSTSGGNDTWLEFEYIISGDGYRRPTKYTYFSGDGGKITFRPTGTGITGGGDGCGEKCAYASEVLEPDGTRYTLSYDNAPSGGAVRLRSVVSNRGYALLFEYAASGTTLVKSCALNLAATAMPPTTGELICPAGARSATYTHTSGVLSSFVDQGGVSANIGPYADKLYRPGEATPYLTNTFSGSKVTSQQFSDGRTITYTWRTGAPIQGALYPNNLGGTYVDNTGASVTVEYEEYTATATDPSKLVSNGPTKVIDQLGRTSTYRYCGVGVPYCAPFLMLEAKSPEGNTRGFTYDDRGRLTNTLTVAKPGSSLTALSTSSTFACTTLWLCQNKPTAVTDAGNHTTEYVYDPVHGQLVLETRPAADANSPRPVKRIAYVQRFAWTKTSGGTYAKASTGVWLKSEERTCRTSATVGNACAGGAADEVVTAYDYGLDTGPNNLLLRGMTVTADGLTLRTCYGYDVNGNRISETKPNANLAVCP